MAPVPILYHPEPAPCTSPHLLQNVWRRLYPEGADPEYRVYREHLAGALYEYYAEVTLHHSSPSGAYTRSTKGGLASTPSQAVQFAAIEALVDLRYNEVRMHTHPGLFSYPFLHENGRIRFPLINPACDRPTSHLARYITASYLLNYELARELSRARATLVAARMGNPLPVVIYTSAPPTSVPTTTSQGTVNPLTVNPRSAPAAWSSLVATPAAPMLRSHPPPAPEGEPSRQRQRTSLPPEVSTISSGSGSGSGDEPAVAPSEQ